MPLPQSGWGLEEALVLLAGIGDRVLTGVHLLVVSGGGVLLVAAGLGDLKVVVEATFLGAAVTEVQGRDGRGIAGVNRVGEGDGEGSGGGLRVEALIEDVRTVHATRGDEAVNALRTLVGL